LVHSEAIKMLKIGNYISKGTTFSWTISLSISVSTGGIPDWNDCRISATNGTKNFEVKRQNVLSLRFTACRWFLGNEIPVFPFYFYPPIANMENLNVFISVMANKKIRPNRHHAMTSWVTLTCLI
jgi:hypothetical protein